MSLFSFVKKYIKWQDIYRSWLFICNQKSWLFKNDLLFPHFYLSQNTQPYDFLFLFLYGYVKLWLNRKYIQVYNWHTQGNDKHSRPTPTFDQKGNAKTKRRISLRIISYYSKRALNKQHRSPKWTLKPLFFDRRK